MCPVGARSAPGLVGNSYCTCVWTCVDMLFIELLVSCPCHTALVIAAYSPEVLRVCPSSGSPFSMILELSLSWQS